ncbi:hypothetical protein [Streptomyces sp. RKAG293]|uniref:hypothetical protein n=1 Tax=Streptomyces sp. RKAG293 TaxID=2893403 RepID=UPI002034A233|nr:hypothetical protein [Streptomyces sp. RKAG293]MCM2416944.1 hypothetical protein [Streptomyces sp. RKAG293]
MGDARQEIAAALADTAVGEPEAALRVLGRALRWSAAALGDVDGGAAGSRALVALFALDDALEESRGLAEAMAGLLAVAAPGQGPGSRTEELMRQLTDLSERVEGERAALEKLAATEEALRDRLAAHEGLRRQVDELRRLERLVLALDALQEQQEVIARRLAELRGRDSGVDEALWTSSDALVRLSDDQLAALAPQTRQVLERAADAQRALAAQEREHAASAAELAAYQDRSERIRSERGGQLASLRRYAAADRDLARALQTPQGAPAGTATEEQQISLAEVETAAADIERRLRAADDALTRVLAERELQDRDGRFMVQRTG